MVNVKDGTCVSGHKFPRTNGIIDLLPNLTDKHLLEEASYFDDIATKGKMIIEPHPYFLRRIAAQYEREFCKFITRAIPGHRNIDIKIGEIGCGSGSAITYLSSLPFKHVDYYGIDISLQLMHKGIVAREKQPPSSWRVTFARGDATTKLFGDDTMDIIFSASALHHFSPMPLVQWISKVLKKGGLLVLNEPSIGNWIARIGRKIQEDINTSNESPIDPRELREMARIHDLQLLEQEGMNFLTGPAAYLLGKINAPNSVAAFAYPLTRFIDVFARSEYRNYSFMQIYRKL